MTTKLSRYVRTVLLSLLLYSRAWAQLPAAPANPASDDRYKADILLIVAHPDDDSLAAPYLAKAILVHFRVRQQHGKNLVWQIAPHHLLPQTHSDLFGNPAGGQVFWTD